MLLRGFDSDGIVRWYEPQHHHFYCKDIREQILAQTLKESQQEPGAFELDESYFGAKQVTRHPTSSPVVAS
ncbi:MAG: hypothetical protein LBT46_10790 [Planctomycetaceae bacterium]|nr:hypothetical protein [Planctomycetaceae bacterium]